MAKSKYEKAVEKLCNFVVEYTEDCPYSLFDFKYEKCDSCDNTFKKCWKKWALDEVDKV